MSNIADIPKNTLKVEIGKTPIVFIPSVQQAVARHRMGLVYLKLDNLVVEMNTLTAHRIGMALALADTAPDEMVILIINGERVELLKPFAVKVATALLRKADDADDWQLTNKRKLT